MLLIPVPRRQRQVALSIQSHHVSHRVPGWPGRHGETVSATQLPWFKMIKAGMVA